MVVVVAMSKWIFENILVVTPPENRCDSRAPRGLPRPRCGVASHPHSSPTICRRMNGCRALLGERGAWRGALPGTGPLAPRGGGESYPKTAATPDLHLASRLLAVAPRPSHTTALRFAGERTGADERLGERVPLGEGSAHSPGWRIIVNTWKS